MSVVTSIEYSGSLKYTVRPKQSADSGHLVNAMKRTHLFRSLNAAALVVRQGESLLC